MTDIVIKAENLGKKYVIGHQAENGAYLALRDVLMQNARTLWNKTKDLAKGKPIIQGDTWEEVWALKDVSFEIRRGEAVGIIGRNGAGKSTLLKILSRITEPSTGRVTIEGRVASLLEVGTGFHPELTGRENIYLNGTILGMTRKEIKRKFDEIVAFAEVEKYLDTPVKRYSSGMYVRLAFAVAAHLEPEILVVDEVLAVGDAQFQKKCLGKMGDVARGGRTVLFVSHNMQAISSLCNRAFLIHSGEIIADKITDIVIKMYLSSSTSNTSEISWTELDKAPGDNLFKLLAIRLMTENGASTSVFNNDQKVIIEYEFYLAKIDSSLTIGFDLVNSEGVVILRSYQNDGEEKEWPSLKNGINRINCEIPDHFLNAGIYFISPRISLHCIKWIVHSDYLISFEVMLTHGKSPFWNALDSTNKPGVLSIILPWCGCPS